LKEKYMEWREYVNRTRSAFSSRRKHLWAALVERDGEKCQKCGATEKLQIDHIIQVVNYGTNDLSNLRILCKTCNVKAIRMVADGRPCFVCGEPATGYFGHKWFCSAHLQECEQVYARLPYWMGKAKAVSVVAKESVYI
jgi:hypothetical protein